MSDKAGCDRIYIAHKSIKNGCIRTGDRISGLSHSSKEGEAFGYVRFRANDEISLKCFAPTAPPLPKTP